MLNKPYKVIKKPIITEKTQDLLKNNQYVFEIDIKANKREIKKAVEDFFQVKVIDVNTMRKKGKLRRVRYKWGMTPRRKKAIVTLKEGDTISFFEGV
ncbi:MAG: 50S ribosomal protein L23 [bacterium]|nr:50S ribosomal protein L23 [bacterium]